MNRSKSPNAKAYIAKRAVVLAIGWLLSACATGPAPDYQRGAMDVPSTWREPLPPQSEESPASSPWWRSFGDPRLNALLEDVLVHNNSLAVSSVTLYRAQVEAGLARTTLSPDVTVMAGRSNSRRFSSEGTTTKSAGTSVEVSYEIDVWGRLSRLREAAGLEAEATEYDRRATALTLVGTAARLYWRIASLNAQVAATRRSAEIARQTLELATTRFDVGAISAMSREQAQAAVETLDADLAELVALREVDRNALAILADRSPAERSAELAGLPMMAMPSLPATLPADLLARRPDLRAAESRLRKSVANSEAARLAFYPTFSLTSSLTTSGSSLADILKNPVGTIGGALALPFVQWNVARLTSNSAKAAFDAALIEFRQAFYQAMADAQSAISASKQSALEVARRKAALDAHRRAEAVAEARFRAGRTGAKEWLDLQQETQASALRLEQAIYTQYANEVTLFLALGGDPWAQSANP